MELDKEKIKQFQKEILDWYKVNKRDLPWRRVPFDTRLKMRDPYKILVSEIMLQQTQVSRVIPKYHLWLKTFPTIQSLAKASVVEVLRVWSGLGYNRRALYLRKAARIIVGQYKGKLPSTMNELTTLPGIGEYTARAVLCFAFDQQVAVVDTNVRKMILIKFYQNHPERAKRVEGSHGILPLRFAQDQNDIQRVADQLLPKGVLRLRLGQKLKAGASEWNQALMDYSALVLSSAKLSKQSRPKDDQPLAEKFKGSNRYYRGQIVKLLLEHKKMEIGELRKLFGKRVEDKKIQHILAGLIRDDLIEMKNNTVALRSL